MANPDQVNIPLTANGFAQPCYWDAATSTWIPISTGKAKANGWQGIVPVRSSDGAEIFPLDSDTDAAGLAGSARVLNRNLQFNGATWDRQRTPAKFIPVSLAAATAETTIWTPAGGKKFRLMGFLLTPGAASTLTFKDNTGGTTIFTARGGTDQPISPAGMGNGILSTAANNVLTVTRGTSCTLDGVVWGTEE